MNVLQTRRVWSNNAVAHDFDAIFILVLRHIPIVFHSVFITFWLFKIKVAQRAGRCKGRQQKHQRVAILLFSRSDWLLAAPLRFSAAAALVILDQVGQAGQSVMLLLDQ